MSLIKVVNASKKYGEGESAVTALRNINLEIARGEFLALLGPSGSGKSTLLSMMGGLSSPTEGEVTIDDISVYGLDEERRADFRHEYIGFVFQQYQLLPYLTAIENVMLPLAITKISHREQKERAQIVLDQVGLGHKSLRLPNQLSGGEQSRVAIARAIINEPDILCADEPTGSLDSHTAREVLELFQKLNGEGQTILMVTHNLENLKYVSRAIYIRDGALETLPTDIGGNQISGDQQCG